ncbi:MAG: tripartite tricarboxylate transporter substrate binding protein [Betaproteobacteria bacterium]
MLALVPAALLAQDYPAKGRPITTIVPSTAGGGTDTAARLVAPLMEKDLGVPVQVVNKPGASMQIGVTEVALAKPDGYTLLWSVLPTAASIYLDPERKAAFARKDLQPIGMVYGAPFAIFVLASSPYKTIQDVIAAAKANPGKVKSGTTGHMSTGHFANIEFQRGANIRMATVHFQGGGPELTAVLGGHIDVGFNSIGELLGQVKTGNIRVLAVMDDQESEYLPGVKTLAAQGVKANAIGSDIGLSAPAGVPKEIITKLTVSLKKAMNDEGFRKSMAEQGNTVKYLDPEQYRVFWNDVDAKYAPLIELAKQK